MNMHRIVQKGKRAVGHDIQSWAKRRRRHYGTLTQTQRNELLAKEHVKNLESKHKEKRTARAIDKDFFLSVLKSSATKREAKSYIQRFDPAQHTAQDKPTDKNSSGTKLDCGVNLGGFYGPVAVEESPKFVQLPAREARHLKQPQLHVALVKVRAPQTQSDETINGIGRTLSQLGRLGLLSVVVVDCNSQDASPSRTDKRDPNWRTIETQQANRLVLAIERNKDIRARLIDEAIGVSEKLVQPGSTLTKTHVSLKNLLMTPLRKGVIPVVPAVGYSNVTQIAMLVPAGEIILALTRDFAGLPSDLLPDEDPYVLQARLKACKDEISLDRLIILDPLGGIPTSDRSNGYHVFLNMEQEFETAKQDLLKGLQWSRENELEASKERANFPNLDISKPSSKSIEYGLDTLKASFRQSDPAYSEQSTNSIPPSASLDLDIKNPSKLANSVHLLNLQLARSVLCLLPPSSSALITTPSEAANSGKHTDPSPLQVSTRRQRNALIHNLLTDKPVFSSSLPLATNATLPSSKITPTTFAKHGMCVTVFPEPKVKGWIPPVKDGGQPQVRLTDTRLDLGKLVHLIDDSFNRRLDVPAYLSRVKDNLAGVIIAGSYEGGAILTWEPSPLNPSVLVPYLDKFAVLKRSQGSGGVADLIFKTMVRDCFPGGVCWRSRKDNPVNKWYFERSRGTWKIPGTGWAMFWTTPELNKDEKGEGMFRHYEAVCRSIQPTWADNKKILD